MFTRYLNKILVIILLSCISVNKVTAQINELDSAKKAFASYKDDETAYIQTSFFIADQYMDVEQYDSAQEWLSKIHDRIPAKKTSLFNYFLTSRQAEVYYYNNLQQLGLQESFRGLKIAQELNDSLLLMDSYNFLGIFYMNLDSSNKAVSFFKSGLNYINQPHNPEKYIALSKPLHLYGNLSEAYYKISKYDSALYYIRISLEKSYKTSWERGIAVGHAGVGDIFLELNQADSALVNYQIGKSVAAINNDIDIELLCFGGLAKVYNGNNDYSKAIGQLDSGFALLADNPNLNRYFSLQFLNTAVSVYKSRNDNTRLVKTLELKSRIESENLANNNSQLQSILNAGVENEKSLLILEVNEANQNKKLANTRLIIVIVALVLLSLGFILYRNLQRQKLATAAMRQKISQDLHDDIGASLSSLHIYSSIAEKNVYTNPAKSEEMMQKIYSQSQFLMNNMNDIVWSMKSADDDGTTLETQIKNFGADLLNDINVSFTYQMDQEVEKLLQSIYSRKNLLLIIKEAINNMAKHSRSTEASLKLGIKDDTIELVIKDNGVGFDVNNNREGNGLKNMQSRVIELKGNMTVHSGINEGTQIEVLIPKASFKE